MDWTVYWFMLPVCIAIAGMAMFSGISGAAMLTPVFLIGFPLFDVPGLTTVEAVGTALLLETSGFGMGLYRYLSLRLVDLGTAWRLVAVTLPLGMLGAIASAQAPCPRRAGPRVTARDGRQFTFCAHGIPGQQVLSGAGAFFAGLISTGVGEATLPGLVRRSRFPIAVAAATSTVVVAGTVVRAALTHMVQLAAEGGLAAIPWDLIVWAVPGAALGALLGTGLQGRVSPTATRWFFGALFLLIGTVFLLAFTCSPNDSRRRRPSAPPGRPRARQPPPADQRHR
jgi:uncharacterized protein